MLAAREEYLFFGEGMKKSAIVRWYPGLSGLLSNLASSPKLG